MAHYTLFITPRGFIMLTLCAELEIGLWRDETVEELVAAGNYRKTSQDICGANFLPESWEVKKPMWGALVKMFRTEYKMQFEDLRLALHENHCRPASLREGLTFGIAKPDLHACYTILVPGSFWRSRTGYAFRFILELFSISGERHLYLRQLDMTLEAGAYVLGTYWRR